MKILNKFKGFSANRYSREPLEKLFAECWPGDYNRHEVCTWEDFLFYIENIDDYDDLPSTINKPSVDEFKEILIETNFGSFIMDW